MSEFSIRDGIAILAILAIGALAIFMSPYWFGTLIFPVLIWADVWAQKKKKNG